MKTAQKKTKKVTLQSPTTGNAMIEEVGRVMAEISQVVPKRGFRLIHPFSRMGRQLMTQQAREQR